MSCSAVLYFRPLVLISFTGLICNLVMDHDSSTIWAGNRPVDTGHVFRFPSSHPLLSKFRILSSLHFAAPPPIHSGLHPHHCQRALLSNKFYMITSTSAVKAPGKIILRMKGSHSLGCFPQWTASCGGLSTGILSLQTLLFSFHSLFKVSPGWNRFALRHWADSFNCFISNDPSPLIFACSSEDAEIALSPIRAIFHVYHFILKDLKDWLHEFSPVDV